MFVVSLGPSMYDCPECWKNFIHKIQDDRLNGRDNGVPHAVINEYLKEHNGTYTKVIRKGYQEAKLVFNNKQDYLAFTLKNL